MEALRPGWQGTHSGIGRCQLSRLSWIGLLSLVMNASLPPLGVRSGPIVTGNRSASDERVSPTT